MEIMLLGAYLCVAIVVCTGMILTEKSGGKNE